jgi:hypothetical protein
MSDLKSTIAGTTPHDVPGNWPEGSALFFRNPTNGAVEVRPEHRDKVARSLTRHARSMKRSLFIQQLRLKIEYLALQIRRAACVLGCDLLRLREKAFRYSHSILPRKGNHAD